MFVLTLLKCSKRSMKKETLFYYFSFPRNSNFDFYKTILPIGLMQHISRMLTAHGLKTTDTCLNKYF